MGRIAGKTRGLFKVKSKTFDQVIEVTHEASKLAVKIFFGKNSFARLQLNVVELELQVSQRPQHPLRQNPCAQANVQQQDRPHGIQQRVPGIHDGAEAHFKCIGIHGRKHILILK